MAFIGWAIIVTMCIFLLGHLVDWRMTRVCGVASMTIMLLRKFLVVFLELTVPFLRYMICSGGMRMAASITEIVMASTIVCVVADRFIQRFAPWAVGLRRRIQRARGSGVGMWRRVLAKKNV